SSQFVECHGVIAAIGFVGHAAFTFADFIDRHSQVAVPFHRVHREVEMRVYRKQSCFRCYGHGFSSNTASISTGILSGSDPIPTALLTPTPLSVPHTLANNSLHPLMTYG